MHFLDEILIVSIANQSIFQLEPMRCVSHSDRNSSRKTASFVVADRCQDASVRQKHEVLLTVAYFDGRNLIMAQGKGDPPSS
jgi:hypothetical protein